MHIAGGIVLIRAAKSDPFWVSLLDLVLVFFGVALLYVAWKLDRFLKSGNKLPVHLLLALLARRILTEIVTKLMPDPSLRRPLLEFGIPCTAVGDRLRTKAPHSWHNRGPTHGLSTERQCDPFAPGR
jgi:hypothetical protein